MFFFGLTKRGDNLKMRTKDKYTLIRLWMHLFTAHLFTSCLTVFLVLLFSFPPYASLHASCVYRHSPHQMPSTTLQWVSGTMYECNDLQWINAGDEFLRLLRCYNVRMLYHDNLRSFRKIKDGAGPGLKALWKWLSYQAFRKCSIRKEF